MSGVLPINCFRLLTVGVRQAAQSHYARNVLLLSPTRRKLGPNELRCNCLSMATDSFRQFLTPLTGQHLADPASVRTGLLNLQREGPRVQPRCFLPCMSWLLRLKIFRTGLQNHSSSGYEKLALQSVIGLWHLKRIRLSLTLPTSFLKLRPVYGDSSPRSPSLLRLQARVFRRSEWLLPG